MDKILITDLDGTLLNDDGTVPSSFIQFLKLLIDNKISLVFASSRSPQNIQSLFSKFDFNYCSICSDGSSFVKHKNNEIEIIKEINLTNDSVIKIIDELSSIGINQILLFTNHSNEYNIYSLNAKCPNKILKEVLSDGRNFIELDINTDQILLNNQIINFTRAISIFDESDIIESIYESLSILPVFIDQKIYKYPETRYYGMKYAWIDIIPKNLSKGMVVNELKKSFFRNKFIIALGNGVNDRELFKESDLSFCPINSDYELLKISDIIVNEKNGDDFLNSVSNHLLTMTI